MKYTSIIDVISALGKKGIISSARKSELIFLSQCGMAAIAASTIKKYYKIVRNTGGQEWYVLTV